MTKETTVMRGLFTRKYIVSEVFVVEETFDPSLYNDELV